MNYAFLALVGWLAFAGLGAWVATQKGRGPAEGLILGLLFGPYGTLIEALLPNQEGGPPGPDHTAV